ncbi:phytoene dehydrogenase-like protein [Crossiella equi]|uniref:Pyridine nucleotide-disulfide oxidoreductase domain-containing protein 2 n=1 Tax=Crossiella equi TaxID=130796 RepID=A0ABS5A7P5_9PSEU|nr:NAD(P)/FAD-dependent oxidoreductase [Crossiella equi]MBP2472618.1 phytoene dehydrogenase-like protein [Crossiella equi]
MAVHEVDAVVVGAGPNGLVAANLLADAGWDVLVLEARDAPGGAVRTAEITAPGFRNDLFSSCYPLGVVSPVLAGLDLGEHGLRWAHAPHPLTHVLPDQRAAKLCADPADTAAAVETFAAGDGEAWLAEFALWQRVREALVETVLRPFPPVRPALALGKELGVADGLRFARMGLSSSRVYTTERFSGEGARVLFAGNGMHTDQGPDAPGTAVFGWLLTMLAQDVGFPVPRGGAGALTDALVRRLGTRGGTVHCGRGVRRVLVGGGVAVGVEDVHGERYRARRAVLADVPADVLYRDLVGRRHLPSRLWRDLARFRWDDATVKVNWALSGPIPWLAGQAHGAAVVHLGTDLDGMTRFAADLACGAEPEHPFVLLGQMSTADPTRSPAGTESAWAYFHVPRGLDWTQDRVRRYADLVESLVERHAPGFRSLVLGRAVQAPPDLQGHNPNLVDGAVNAGTTALYQQLVFRPVPGLGRADTPVDRLFLAGAAAHPGGAVHGGPGGNAARAALARNGVAGPVYATVVRGLHRMIYS